MQKPTREDVVSASLVTPIIVHIPAVDPWSPLLTEIQNFTHGTVIVEEKQTHLLACFLHRFTVISFYSSEQTV